MFDKHEMTQYLNDQFVVDESLKKHMIKSIEISEFWNANLDIGLYEPHKKIYGGGFSINIDDYKIWLRQKKLKKLINEI